MQVPVQVAFRNMEHNSAIEADVLSHVEKLQEFSDRITSCTVTVEAPHQHHRQGNLYQVRVHLAIPRHRDIVVGRDDGTNHAHEDVHVAIRDTFRAAKRQLQDAVRMSSDSGASIRHASGPASEA